MLVVNRGLRSVAAGACDVGDQGVTAVAEALHRNSTLQNLDLDGNHCGNAGARAVAQMLLAHARHRLSAPPALQTLGLSGDPDNTNHVGDIGATHLADALREHVTLTELRLEDSTVRPSVQSSPANPGRLS